MNPLRYLKNRIRGWLPKEPNLTSFHGTSGNQSLKLHTPETQTEKELYSTVKFEIDKWHKWLTYIGLIAYLIFGHFLFLLLYSSHSSSFADSIALFPLLIWFIILYAAEAHAIVVQFRYMTRVKQALKKALIPAAQALLSYYDVAYKARKNGLLFNFYVVLVLMAYWSFGTLLGYWTLNSSASFLYYVLFGVSAAFCLVAIPLMRRETRGKKAKTQNMIDQLRQQP